MHDLLVIALFVFGLPALLVVGCGLGMLLTHPAPPERVTVVDPFTRAATLAAYAQSLRVAVDAHGAHYLADEHGAVLAVLSMEHVA